MTITSPAKSDRAEFVLSLLEWLEGHEVPTAAVDETLSLLASQRRRLLLSVMATYGQELTLPDAAEEVAVREAGQNVRELSAERIATVYISLYHDHLPRLVDAGLLEYDQERDLVSPAGIR